jgi:hypothetical protein
VTVLCDHKNLEYFMSSRQLTRRQARWALFFSEFSFVLTYRPGSRNGKADSLSRRPDYAFGKGEKDDKYNFRQLINPTQILAAVSRVNDNNSFLDRVRDATIGHPLLQQLPTDSSLLLEDGLILKDHLVFLPSEDLRLEVLRSRHDSPAAGHFGIAKTNELVSRDFWWPRMKHDISNYVQSYEYARSKVLRHKPHVLQPIPVPSRPWSVISMQRVLRDELQHTKDRYKDFADPFLFSNEYARRTNFCPVLFHRRLLR